VNNKHDCAGYGDDHASSSDAKDNTKKAARRESHAPAAAAH
jgi:hypothetical protein